MRYTFLGLFGSGSWLRNAVAAGVTCVAQALAAYWGAAPALTRTLLVAAAALYLCDTVAGTIVAVARKQFDSRRIGQNLTKLIAYLLSMMVGCAVGEALAASGVTEEILSPYTLMTWLLLVIAMREATSFVENSAVLGFPWPGRLLELLVRVKDEVEQQPPADGAPEAGPDEPE